MNDFDMNTNPTEKQNAPAVKKRMKTATKNQIKFFIAVFILIFAGVGLWLVFKPPEIRLIENADDFYNIRNNLYGKYKLVNDIDLSKYGEDYNGGAGWTAIGTLKRPFQGELDGDGYSITGLYINNSSSQYVGLFGYTKEAEIRNLFLKDVNISTTKVSSITGSLVSINSDTSLISGCAVSGKINVQASNTITGGFVGDNLARIIDCYCTVDVSVYSQNHAWAGGFAGRNRGADISYSYSAGVVSLGMSPQNNADKIQPYIGAFAGMSYGNSIFGDCYYNTDIAGKNYASEMDMCGTGFYEDKPPESSTTGGKKDPVGLLKETTNKLQSNTAYQNWSADIWNFSAGFYPRLKSLRSQEVMTKVGVDNPVIEIPLTKNGANFVNNKKNLKDFIPFNFMPENASHKSCYFVIGDEYTVTTSGLITLSETTASAREFTVTARFEGGNNVPLTVKYYYPAE